MNEKHREQTIRTLVALRKDLDQLPANERGRVFDQIAAIRREMAKQRVAWNAINSEAHRRYVEATS